MSREWRSEKKERRKQIKRVLWNMAPLWTSEGSITLEKTVENTLEFLHMKGKVVWHLVFKPFSSKG